MANYKETTGSGTAWKRARQVLISNDLNNPEKTILFFEEDVATIGDKQIKADSRLIQTVFDPEASISLRDPTTGEYTGNTVSQYLVYQALYSLYLNLAEAQDTAPTNIM